jgi:hypothetical protein
MVFLSVKAVDYSPRVDNYGLAENSWEMIAGALGAVHHPGADLLRAMYGGDHGACRKVLARLKGALLADLGIDRAGVISEKVMRAFLFPPICPSCNGHGSLIINALKIECKKCHGTGAGQPQRMNGEEEGAFDILRRWHDSASAIVYRELNSDE